jgi:hypothetical protein
MAEPSDNDQFVKPAFTFLIVAAIAMLLAGVYQLFTYGDGLILAIGVLASVTVCGQYITATNQSAASAPAAADGESETNRWLKSINDRLLISDQAKRIAYRQKDRDALRTAIKEDIDKRDYDAALVLVEQMSKAYGYREESEEFREKILRARAADQDRKISESIAAFEILLGKKEWENAGSEAAKIRRLYPESTRVRDLPRRVRDAREEYKKDIERQFLAAAEREENDRAMELLQEMDKYLTEQEAIPFREAAKNVIGKKRENLKVQFEMSISEKDFNQAIRIGEQIAVEFPNSKMAQDVKALIPKLKEKATMEKERLTAEANAAKTAEQAKKA